MCCLSKIVLILRTHTYTRIHARELTHKHITHQHTYKCPILQIKAHTSQKKQHNTYYFCNYRNFVKYTSANSRNWNKNTNKTHAFYAISEIRPINDMNSWTKNKNWLKRLDFLLFLFFSFFVFFFFQISKFSFFENERLHHMKSVPLLPLPSRHVLGF